MPTPIDDDGEEVKVEVDLGTAVTFCKFDDNTYTFTILADETNESHAGEYNIKIKLTDESEVETKYTLILNIVDPSSLY